MQRPEAATLLHAWERGAAQSPTMRGLLLLAAASPGATAGELAATCIGERDARLLELREVLFGELLECIASCPHCGERIELGFPARGIRASYGSSPATFDAEAGGYQVRFRLPCSADLLALVPGSDPAAAELELLRRCVVEVRTAEGQPCEIGELHAEAVASIDRCMGELESQAQVEIDVGCPSCQQPSRTTFDIVTHLWSELESWARNQLREIHALAASYGWAEAQILAMSPVRRRAYLQLIGVAG